MVNDYFVPIYCILPKKCVVKEIFISEWRIGDVHVNLSWEGWQHYRKIERNAGEVFEENGTGVLSASGEPA